VLSIGANGLIEITIDKREERLIRHQYIDRKLDTKDIRRQEEALALVSPDYIVVEHVKIKRFEIRLVDDYIGVGGTGVGDGVGYKQEIQSN
jgi:hypothetical protein